MDAMLGIYWEDFGAIGADLGATSVYVGSILVQFWEVLGGLGRHTSGSVFDKGHLQSITLRPFAEYIVLEF